MDQRSTQLVIRMDLESGKIIKITDEHGKEAGKLDCTAAYERLWSKDPKFVASLFWTHSSPGCGWCLQDGFYNWICDD